MGRATRQRLSSAVSLVPTLVRIAGDLGPCGAITKASSLEILNFGTQELGRMNVVMIEDARTRDQVRQLVERLVCEYAGAVPVGNVIRATLRSANALYRLGARDARLLELADQATRRTLIDQIARYERTRPVAKAG